MRKNAWIYTVRITLVGKKEKTQERLQKILNKKDIVAHDVVGLINGYTGGTYSLDREVNKT